jgi:hypothetical protein
MWFSPYILLHKVTSLIISRDLATVAERMLLPPAVSVIAFCGRVPPGPTEGILATAYNEERTTEIC